MSGVGDELETSAELLMRALAQFSVSLCVDSNSLLLESGKIDPSHLINCALKQAMQSSRTRIATCSPSPEDAFQRRTDFRAIVNRSEAGDRKAKEELCSALYLLADHIAESDEYDLSAAERDRLIEVFSVPIEEFIQSAACNK